MLGLGDLRETKVYQEALQEGEKRGEKRGEKKGEKRGERKAKIESVKRLRNMGLSLEDIAQGLDLPIEEVQQAAKS